jgi:hypothetical protein
MHFFEYSTQLPFNWHIAVPSARRGLAEKLWQWEVFIYDTNAGR